MPDSSIEANLPAHVTEGLNPAVDVGAADENKAAADSVET